MSIIIDVIGSIGAILFATACVPMAWKTWKAGKGIGTPLATVWTFVGATALFGLYLGEKVGWSQVPTLLIYVEFICWSIALWYHYFPRGWTERLYSGVPLGMFCTRNDGHDGKCNGYPRELCPMTPEERRYLYPNSSDKDSAARIFKETSD